MMIERRETYSYRNDFSIAVECEICDDEYYQIISMIDVHTGDSIELSRRRWEGGTEGETGIKGVRWQMGEMLREFSKALQEQGEAPAIAENFFDDRNPPYQWENWGDIDTII